MDRTEAKLRNLRRGQAVVAVLMLLCAVVNAATGFWLPSALFALSAVISTVALLRIRKIAQDGDRRAAAADQR